MTSTRRRPADTKLETMLEMLRDEDGATVREMAFKLEWEPTTVRANMTLAVKRRLGLVVTSEKNPDRGRVYRIV